MSKCKAKVEIPPIQTDIDDDQFIEDYLDQVFGEYKETIKLYMALVIFSNYRRLPTLILTGARSASKTTFANLLSAAYHSMSTTIQTVLTSFNPWAGKKIVTLDEGASEGKSQYREFKRISGGEWISINEKYKNEYKVRNNSTLIILSNDMFPITVEESEIPTDEAANQFLVLRLSKLNKTPDPLYGKKLEERLGHYIQNVLRSIYDSHDTSVSRYGMLVPITEWEEQLFKNSMTETDYVIESLIDALVDILNGSSDFYSSDDTLKFALEEGYVPKEVIDKIAKEHKMKISEIHERLTSKGLCEPLRKQATEKYERPQINGKRPRCREMTNDLKTMLDELKSTNSAPDLFGE